VASISLCLIVRDEEEMLPEFLTSCAGAWDELVAVDTGSTDGTVGILQAAGARVLHEPWTGDFSAARNASLAAATGDWILILDPDERPGAGFAQELRELCAEPAVGAATVLMRNLLAFGHTRDVPLLRVFRRGPGVRFEHAIHEDAFGSVQAMLRAGGLELAGLHTPVVHLGYLRERAADRGKKSRDAEALARCIAADADDLYSHFKLLELARFWSDPKLLAESAPAAEAALRRSGGSKAPWAGDLVVLLARSAGEEALSRLDDLSGLVTPNAALHLARGEFLEEAGRLEEAADEFEACLEIGEDPTAQLVLTRPLLGLARVALAEGRFEDAMEDIDTALQTAPRDPEALLAALSLRTGPARAEFADGWRAAHGDTDELARAEGEAALLAGDASDAVEPLRRVVGTPPSGRSSIRLAQALLLSDRADEATETLLAVVEALPEAGMGLVVCDTIAGRTRDLTLDLSEEQAGQSLVFWIQILQDRPDLLLAFARNSVPLHPTFPWLSELLA
jgi:tetratricopeptide (TPR) repeat protein